MSMNRSLGSRDYDAIVIGAGHNGLTAAAILAKSGLNVLVIERRQILGGAASAEEAFAGCQVSVGALDAGLFLPQLIAELGLERYGLRWVESPALTTVFASSGKPLTLWRDVQRTAREIAQYSTEDARRYPEFVAQVYQLSAVLAEMMTLTPPALPVVHLSDLAGWLRPALQARRLGEKAFMAMLRILPMSVADYLDEWFETPALKSALGSTSVIGQMQGPRAPGTAFLLLYHAIHVAQGETRSSRFVQGGPQALIQALARSASEHGAELCTGLAVVKVLINDDRAIGVELENGECLYARAMLSSLDARRTLFDLVGAPNLEVRMVREVKNIRLSGSLARLNLLLSDLPQFNIQEAERERISGHIVICPDLDYLERAYDDAKYGQFSQKPFLDVVIPTITDPSLAPAERHLMNINIQYTPRWLKSGDWNDQRQALLEVALDTLATYAPDLRRYILDYQLLTPLDLERELGLSEGDINQGQMGLDQLLFMRPIPGFPQYRMPLDGLYLCGAGAHPGGGLTGAPGYNAARQVLRILSAR